MSTIGPFSEKESKYIQNLINTLSLYDPKEENMIVIENDELAIASTTDEVYKQFREEEGREKVSKKIVQLLDLSPKAKDSIDKSVYHFIRQKIEVLTLEWDPNFNFHLKEMDTLQGALFMVQSQHLLNLLPVMSFVISKLYPQLAQNQ
ncbi:MAG: hypothetical protein L0207_05005 [Chlamydiae bacterium]|nr:hypothetical protein [Chlamydiota bacterium]